MICSFKRSWLRRVDLWIYYDKVGVLTVQDYIISVVSDTSKTEDFRMDVTPPSGPVLPHMSDHAAAQGSILPHIDDPRHGGGSQGIPELGEWVFRMDDDVDVGAALAGPSVVGLQTEFSVG